MPEGCVASVVGARVHAGLWFPSPNPPPPRPPPQQTLAIRAGFPDRVPRN